MSVASRFYQFKIRLSGMHIHISWLIAIFSSGILVGAVFSSRYSQFYGIDWLFVAGCLIALFVATRKSGIAIIAALAAGIILGLWRGGVEIQNQSALNSYIDKTVIVQGVVSEDPSYNTEGDLRFKLKDLIVQGEKSAGVVWVSSRSEVDIKRSDTVVVEGEVSKGFGNFPASMYQARIVYAERQDYADVARDTRDWFAENIREGVREPEASLGAGFLLGQKTDLPEKLDTELRLLGLTHIVVASGYNLSILARYARRVFERISRFTALAASGLLVFFFANITGFSPSMSRASLITVLSLVAWYFGRRFHPVVLLSFSAAVTILLNPSYAWGDIGWLLSFTSFIGVIILSPLIHAYFWGDDKPKNIRQIVVETMSAQLLTMPLIMFVFSQYSPLAILANVLILPFIPIAMLLTFIAGVGAILVPSLASVIAWPAETLLGYMTVVTGKLAEHPLATSEITITMVGVIVFYLGILTAIIHLWSTTKHPFRKYNVIE